MGEVLEYLRELNSVSICLRIVFAVICGGIVGLEREGKGRAAGFRTHILVCVGASLMTMTGQYITQILNASSDPARLGAQVISGIGFLGAGTIITTKRNHVRGLTTAAGLWASACLGLTIGIGFYEAAILGAVVIVFAMIMLQRVDSFFYERRRIREFYIEVEGIAGVKQVINTIKDNDYQIFETIIEQNEGENAGCICVLVTVKPLKKQSASDFVVLVSDKKGVLLVKEF